MAVLPTVQCPGCGHELKSDEYDSERSNRERRASGFESCLRRCEVCGIGLSNGNTGDVSRLTPIYRNPVPEEVSEHVEDVLRLALNEKNRPKKRTEFQSHSSEDAVTWTVFRYLQMSGSLVDVARELGCQGGSQEQPRLLLWGASVPPDDDRAQRVREELISISDRLGERPAYRSEPDIIIDTGEGGVCVLEAKLRSGNDVKDADYAGWPRYVKGTDAFSDEIGPCESGLYELTRNWRIGWELAGARPFTLVNLVTPAALRTGQDRLAAFTSCLTTRHDRQFRQMTWQEIFSARHGRTVPQWLEGFLRNRGALSGEI